MHTNSSPHFLLPFGEPNPINANEVRALFPGLLVLGDRVPGTASPIVDATGRAPRFLRQDMLPASEMDALSKTQD